MDLVYRKGGDSVEKVIISSNGIQVFGKLKKKYDSYEQLLSAIEKSKFHVVAQHDNSIYIETERFNIIIENQDLIFEKKELNQIRKKIVKYRVDQRKKRLKLQKKSHKGRRVSAIFLATLIALKLNTVIIDEIDKEEFLDYSEPTIEEEYEEQLDSITESKIEHAAIIEKATQELEEKQKIEDFEQQTISSMSEKDLNKFNLYKIAKLKFSDEEINDFFKRDSRVLRDGLNSEMDAILTISRSANRNVAIDNMQLFNEVIEKVSTNVENSMPLFEIQIKDFSENEKVLVAAAIKHADVFELSFNQSLEIIKENKQTILEHPRNVEVGVIETFYNSYRQLNPGFPNPRFVGESGDKEYSQEEIEKEIIKYAEIYEFDKTLTALDLAVFRHETGNGTSSVSRRKYNFGGHRTLDREISKYYYWSYPSMNFGAFRQVHLMNNYLTNKEGNLYNINNNEVYSVLSKMGPRYAEDPNWANITYSHYNKAIEELTENEKSRSKSWKI